MTALEEAYAARIDAVEAQRAADRAGRPAPADRWSGEMARRFRADPRRRLDPALEYIASLLRPEDVLVDVGGGAGRVALPLALRCREVVVVDPSPGMQVEFDAVAAENGIANARYVCRDWLEGEPVAGDVTLAAHVTYFVRDIRDFLQRMHAAARRRVILLIYNPPPPSANAGLYQAIRGHEQVRVPGHRELLPVIWELGYLPEIRLFAGGFPNLDVLLPERAAAVQHAVQALEPAGDAQVQAAVEQQFDSLFRPDGPGYRATWREPARTLIISWEKQEN